VADPSTLLFFTSGIPPFSARGLTQTLEPIAQAVKLQRDVNGGLHNLAAPQFTKYKSVISGSDHDTGAFSDVFPGQIIYVSCIQELGFLTSAGAGADRRPAVEGSERVSGDYSFYRPELIMMVTAGPTASWDEWAGVNTWSIELEEI
jgi:hypothetical protein